METKSRYEVISDLEMQKRELIKEKDSFKDSEKAKDKEIKDTERAKNDQIIAWDRKLEDLNEDLANFKTRTDERKETITELIKSVDDSLSRFGKLAKS